MQESIRYTPRGLKAAEEYINGMKIQKERILNAGLDTADEVSLPNVQNILNDVFLMGLDEDGDYFNGWRVTDNYNADYPLLLRLGRDLAIIKG